MSALKHTVILSQDHLRYREYMDAFYSQSEINKGLIVSVETYCEGKEVKTAFDFIEIPHEPA